MAFLASFSTFRDGSYDDYTVIPLAVFPTYAEALAAAAAAADRATELAREVREWLDGPDGDDDDNHRLADRALFSDFHPQVDEVADAPTDAAALAEHWYLQQ